MSTGSVLSQEGRVVTHAADRIRAGVARPPSGEPRNAAPCPSPRTRVTSRLARELARRGLRRLVPLLLLLANEAEGRACTLTQPQIAGQLVVHVRTVRRYEKELQRLGILRIVHHGESNRRLVVLEDLDAQAVTRSDENAPEQPTTYSTGSPQSAEQCGHAGPVSPPPECGHERAPHKGIARVEEPLSDCSGRRAPAAPWTPWRSKESAIAAGCRGARMPEWPGPSAAVDERARQMHRRLAMWPNTLREVVILARDYTRIHDEIGALTYIDALERHALTQRKPGGCALGALRKRTRLPARTERARQLVLEDVGRARHLSGLLDSVLPKGFLRREVRHA